jgi:hypothetical protein
LAVSHDASYRIQYYPKDSSITFSYLPEEVELLTSPKLSSESLTVENNVSNEEKRVDAMDIDKEIDKGENEADDQPLAKRLKTK